MKMRTSPTQFQTLVEYMERNGDISKVADGINGRINNIQSWVRLTKLLNADASGDTKSAAKWRKVWSDLKNNTKRKAARIAQYDSNPNCSRAFKLKLTEVEQKVINIVGQSISSTEIIDFPELNLDEVVDQVEDTNNKESSASKSQSSDSQSGSDMETKIEPTVCDDLMDDWDQAGTSEEPPRKKSKPSIRRRWRTSYQNRKMHSKSSTSRSGASGQNEWLSFQREIEKERIRLRKRELQQQGRWLDLIEQFLDLGNRVVDVMEKK